MKGKKNNLWTSNSWKRGIGLLLVMAMLLSGSIVSFGQGEPGTEPASGEIETEAQEPQTGETQEDPGVSLQTQVTKAQGQAPIQKVSVWLNLNGGRVNGLTAAGWTALESNSFAYGKKIEPGTTLTLESPYRSGYEFVGWRRGESSSLLTPDAGSTTVSVTIAKEEELSAVWTEKLYPVTFRGWAEDSTDLRELWKVEVPYGSVLWAMEDRTPWENPDLDWTEAKGEELPGYTQKLSAVTKIEKALVSVSLGTAEAEGEAREVPVFRYTQSKYAGYYYTFTMEDTLYFTYGGPVPENSRHNFAAWKLEGSQGYTVEEEDAVFSAQYTTKKSYVFHVYYYYENGAKAKDPQLVVKSEGDVAENGVLTAQIPIPEIRYCTPSLDEEKLAEGITLGEKTTDGEWTIQADMNTAFQGGSQANQGTSVVVLYKPSPIDYKVVYHLQKVGTGMDKTGDYEQAGYVSGKALIGSMITVEDRPDSLEGVPGNNKVDFTGFEADLDTQYVLHHGKALEEALIDDTGTAVIHVYYNRSYYYVYTLTDSNESPVFDPVSVQFGASLPEDPDSSGLVKTGYRFSEWKWYSVGQDGTLQPYETVGKKPSVMPYHSMYAVAQWDKSSTSMQVVYWLEDANSGSFQNAYQLEVKDVPTQDELIVYLDEDKRGMELKDRPGTTFPIFTDSFEEAIKSKYGDDNGSYTQYFTFDPEITYQNEDLNKHATGNEAKNELHYVVKADGTTTINLYYRRNLYTIQFVIQKDVRQANGSVTRYLARDTKGGTLKDCTWATWLGSADSVFADFPSEKIVRSGEGDFATAFGNATVLQEYRIKDAVERGDSRAAVGRYCTVDVEGFPCRVYYLTARFEAEVTELWPTMNNIMLDPTATYSDPAQYISLGTHKDSAYYNTEGRDNKNILNQYSTMDALIVNDRDGKAVEDNEEKGVFTHQMFAYWQKNWIKNYDYYFLYETLDTTLNPDDFEEFDENTDYESGTIVKWRSSAAEEYKLYVYRDNGVPQNSFNGINNQNQPARYGFTAMGKEIKMSDAYAEFRKNNPNANEAALHFKGYGGKVYFFYTRNLYNLSIYNVNGNWVPEEALLKQKLTLTYTDELKNEEITGEKSLAELGWERIENTEEAKLIQLRYGASIGVIRQASVTEAFQQDKANPLRYPYKSLGVNQYYFHAWYKDQENIFPVDWTVNAMQNMIQDQVLYTGWTTPKYRVIYTLNGGTWTDEIQMTMMILNMENEVVVVYYPHLTEDPDAEMYWYIPVKKNDYLYMEEFNLCKVGDIFDLSGGEAGHYPLKEGLTLEQMNAVSRPKDPGTTSGGTSYVCYLEENGGTHKEYINRHALAGSELPEPSVPVRNGYEFLGWYDFESIPEDNTFEKIWLDEVMQENGGYRGYKAEYVYINASGIPHLLHEDENGRLFYYEEQNGYRFSFQFGASIASKDRRLYAAWRGKTENECRALYLIRKGDAPSDIPVNWKEVEINGTPYYQVMDMDTRRGVESGSNQTIRAKALTVDKDSRVWLPEKAQISLEIGEGTVEGTIQTVDGKQSYQYPGEGSVFRIKGEAVDDDVYNYYAYFVYTPVQEPSYTIYQINLTEAVANGELDSYSDTFDRSNPPSRNSACVLNAESTILTSLDGVVVANAPRIEGYTVYDRWTETLHLESNSTTNNIYFYYVNAKNDISYGITYHFMTNGAYDNKNVVAVQDIPGQRGQRLNLDEVTAGYGAMLETATRMRGYAESANVAQQDLYKRYQNMVISGNVDQVAGIYAVDGTKECTLDQEKVKAVYSDYRLDDWSPHSEDNSVVLSEGTQIHVYLSDAEVILNKKDSDGFGLRDAEFSLERFRLRGVDEVLTPDDVVIVYEEKEYVKDTGFQDKNGVTDAFGKLIFHDLSANSQAGYVYRIIERKAPTGHIPLVNPVFVRVPYEVTENGETKTYYSVTYDIVNPGISYLPNAGGYGVYIPLFLGGGMITMALFAGDLLYGKRRKKRRNTK